MTAAANAALVQCEVDGVSVPMVRIPTCRVCRSASRRAVEIALAEGRSYTQIVAMLPDSGLTARNVAEHYRRGHLPVQSTEVREIVAARAADNRALVQVAVDRQTERLKLANAVVERAAKRLAAGEIQPSFSEAVAASRLLAEHDAVLIERDRLRDQLKRANKNTTKLFRLVSDIMTEQQWSSLGKRIEADPQTRALWPPFWR
ncbi:MAG TPA: hypothetical protein VK988_15340 [Acidimicrobiales bacterium]|nr:hypothetical protein [Acidimicrobiales bacterium]